ncbi:MAG: DUF2085 domain-containing protein [Anaerolineae bacterium]
MSPESDPLNDDKRRPTELERLPTPRRGLTLGLVVVAVSVIIMAILLPPSTLLGKADVVGYAICHRITERSFSFGGRQMPLCARCTGTFLGALVGLGAMLLYRRRWAAGLPPVPVLGVLVFFVALWGFDGLNSYLTFFPGLPHLYEPRNWLRLTTGLLNGLALVTFVFPIFNFSIWREPSKERVFRNLWELLAVLPVLALLLFVIQGGVEFLLYPLALLSSLGVVMMLTLLNSVIAALTLGRESYALTWQQALVPLTVGAGLAILEMTALILIRAYLTTTLGLTF